MDIRNLSRLTYANGFTLWHYRHNGPIRDVLDDISFFDSASGRKILRPGDKIDVSAIDGGSSFYVDLVGSNYVRVKKWGEYYVLFVDPRRT